MQDGKAAERLAKAISATGRRATANIADTASAEAVKAAVEFAQPPFGALHQAVNNAGIAVAMTPAGELDIADWQRVIDINLSGVFYGLRYQTPAKHGVTDLTKTAAIEYSAQGVRVSYIDTPLLDALDSDIYNNLTALHPIGRFGTAEEVANVIVFLLSDEAAFVTGSQYGVDGAYTAQ